MTRTGRWPHIPSDLEVGDVFVCHKIENLGPQTAESTEFKGGKWIIGVEYLSIPLKLDPEDEIQIVYHARGSR